MRRIEEQWVGDTAGAPIVPVGKRARPAAGVVSPVLSDSEILLIEQDITNDRETPRLNMGLICKAKEIAALIAKERLLGDEVVAIGDAVSKIGGTDIGETRAQIDRMIGTIENLGEEDFLGGSQDLPKQSPAVSSQPDVSALVRAVFREIQTVVLRLDERVLFDLRVVGDSTAKKEFEAITDEEIAAFVRNAKIEIAENITRQPN